MIETLSAWIIATKKLPENSQNGALKPVCSNGRYTGEGFEGQARGVSHYGQERHLHKTGRIH